MRENKLNIHYSYMMPTLILQIVSTLLMISFLSISDYAIYTLYLTTINFLYFLTLGIGEGFILKNRSKAKSQIFGISKLINNYVGLQLVFGLVGVLIIGLTPINNIYSFPLVAMIPMNIFQLTQNIFRNANDAHKLNLFILASRAIFIIDAFVYLLTKSLGLMFGADIAMRTILALIATLIVRGEYQTSTPNQLELKDYVDCGFILMLSNTIFSLTLMIDKYALANDLESLGIYSIAITVVLMFRILLTPLNKVLFVTLDEDYDLRLAEPKLLKMIAGSFVILIPALIIGKSLLLGIDGLSKYIDTLPIIAITLVMVPLMVPLESLVLNISKLRTGKKFLFKSLVVTIIYSLVLFGYTTFWTVNLAVFSLLVSSCYFLAFIIYSYDIFDRRLKLKLYSLYAVLGFVYLVLVQVIIG